MDHHKRTIREEFETEISVTHRVKTVPRHISEPEIRSKSFSINPKRVTGERSRPQWHYVDSAASIRQTSSIACQHLKVRETPVGQENGLGRL
jgi:hypothetical protein